LALTREEIVDRLMLDEEALFMDGFDDCVVGAVSQFGRPPVVCYDLGRVIRKMMDDGASYEEAQEFHEYNQLGAWLGEYTPVFLVVLEVEDERAREAKRKRTD
jgi:hypothetical protein